MKLLKNLTLLAISAALASCASSVARGPQSFDVCAPPRSDKEYLDSLSTMAKTGLLMQAFSAGYAGRPDPIDELLDRKRERDRQNRIECDARKR